MSTKTQEPINVDELVAKFRERNQRPPRNPGELTQFCKQLRGVKPISYAVARKYFQQREQKKTAKRSSASSDEEKRMEEKQPEEESQEAATEDGPGEMAIYQVGDQVTLTKDRSGIIRFVGPVEFSEGTWYGIELHEQFVGKCDGTKDGKQYFECAAKRGIFVREDKIRRRMSRADHARKNTWMQVHAENNSKLRITVDDADEQNDDIGAVPEEKETDEAEPLVDPDDADATKEDAGQSDVPREDSAEAPADGDGDAGEGASQEEKADEESGEDLVVVNEPSATIREIEDDVGQKKRKSVTFSVENDLVPDRTISDYFAASEGHNVLQWVANQADLRLRADLFDLYLHSATSQRLEKVFEHLKAFEDYEQENLLSVDVLPRLCRDAI